MSGTEWFCGVQLGGVKLPAEFPAARNSKAMVHAGTGKWRQKNGRPMLIVGSRLAVYRMAVVIPSRYEECIPVHVFHVEHFLELYETTFNCIIVLFVNIVFCFSVCQYVVLTFIHVSAIMGGYGRKLRPTSQTYFPRNCLQSHQNPRRY